MDNIGYNVQQAIANNGVGEAVELERAEAWLTRMVTPSKNATEPPSTVLPNVVTYTTLISAYANRGDISRVEHLLTTMQNEGVLPNTVTYTAVIKCCVKAKDVAAAMVWFELMQNEGIPVNEVTYRWIQHGHENAGNWAEAEWCRRQRQVFRFRKTKLYEYL